MHIGLPFTIDGRGKTSSVLTEEHIEDLIYSVLFTAPGERVNRPTFGSGLKQLVFAPDGDEVATATQFLVQAALQQWLGEIIHVEAVRVQGEENVVTVTVVYILRQNQQRKTVQFKQET